MITEGITLSSPLRLTSGRIVDPSEIVIGRRTGIKTVNLFEAGIITFERRGTEGAFHQLSVWAAGCSTSLSILDGDRIMYHFPVQQTGSFKMEMAFYDGLRLHICSSVDAPPHLTVNWRVAR